MAYIFGHKEGPVTVTEAFAGIGPFSIVIGFLLSAICFRVGVQRQTKEKVYSQIAELMKTERQLATLHMVKYIGSEEVLTYEPEDGKISR